MTNHDNKAPRNIAAEVGQLAGHSADEIRSTTEITGLDAMARQLYGDKGQSTASPVHCLIWRKAPLAAFAHVEPAPDPRVEQIFQDTLAALHRNKAEGTLYGEDDKISAKMIRDLGTAGYWGLRVPKEYGGAGANDVLFFRVITRLSAAGFHNEAGLASVHGCIGAVGPISLKGSESQKQHYLRMLASGDFTSCFALTELGAGSDLAKVKATARRVGDQWLITGEKRFITGSGYGKLCCLVARVEGEVNEKGEMTKAIFIVELPAADSEQFTLVRYKLHPLKHIPNNGLRFKDFAIPAENRLTAPGDNGMVTAYHGLNYGRIAVEANAAGAIRQILRSITGGASGAALKAALAEPETEMRATNSWGEFRKTLGRDIQRRDLVRERIARLAALTVACDALRDWSASKLWDGYRGELECTMAKVFGSWAQEEAALKQGLLTHGGRSLIKGHLIGDNAHDFLAALIYEGENHMLLMKFFLEMGEEHGEKFMIPLGDGINQLKSLNPKGLLTLAKVFPFYAFWNVQSVAKLFAPTEKDDGLNGRLAKHVAFAQRHARWLAVKLNYYMVKHQVKLGDRQGRVIELSKDVLYTTLMLVTAMHAKTKGDKATLAAADVLCQELRRELKGGRKTDAFFADCNFVANLVIDGQFSQLEGTHESPILWAYNANNEPVDEAVVPLKAEPARKSNKG